MKRAVPFGRREADSKLRQATSGVLAFVALLALLVFSPSASRAAEKTIWQIGKPDHASLEFNQNWDFSQGRNPQFTVGQSTPQRDWSAF